MTCGVCNPEGFQKALNLKPSAKVWGYTCQHAPFAAVRALYFNGAETVFWDTPKAVPVMQRRELSKFTEPVYFREGDVLLIYKEADFGQRASTRAQAIADIEALGVTVQILTDEGRWAGVYGHSQDTTNHIQQTELH